MNTTQPTVPVNPVFTIRENRVFTDIIVGGSTLPVCLGDISGRIASLPWREEGHRTEELLNACHNWLEDEGYLVSIETADLEEPAS